MASLISRKSRCSSFSLPRITVNLAIGSAAEAKNNKIEQAIINSSSVIPALSSPQCWRLRKLRLELRTIELFRSRTKGLYLNVASLVTSGIGFCCESLAFTCTIERFDEPGANAFDHDPISVPLPLTPGVLGCRRRRNNRLPMFLVYALTRWQFPDCRRRGIRRAALPRC